MTTHDPEFDALRHQLTAALKREKRLEDAVRDARHALENSSPGHALVILERALRTKDGAR